MTELAVVGMACRYPDARSPQELWENVLSQRQAFRRFPAERLRIEDYFSPNTSMPDTTYATQGAFIENYEFDRLRFRISGNSYRASDLVHWLALDIASQALADAGFSTPSTIPSDTTSVIVGNTLTGEFSRANGLRLRWPYVRRVVEAALRQEGWSIDQCQPFLKQLETKYKEPFNPIGEETLAGGLSNTIAGRICNYFDLKGGGYTVDGACASSLLAIATACTRLATGEIDLAVAGGVDLSLDPFEIIGFAKTAALAPDAMHVYDQHSNGFIPGEGCGFVVLMRYEDALAQQRRIYALVRGWGISSDGSGGMTRPEVEGQILALKRAYQKANIGIESVAYFEGHGTGTNVGDATELQTITRARQQASTTTRPATIGSIKTNIGHTKAAAGVAGFIKATMALSTQVIPPTTATTQPHSKLTEKNAALTVRDTGMIWPSDLPLRAGVSAMGFGGINTHLVLEGTSNHRRTTLTQQERGQLSSHQDTELILLSAQDSQELKQQVDHLLTFTSRLSRAELTDLAVYSIRTLVHTPVRAAVIASSPSELTRRMEHLQTLLEHPSETTLESNKGIFLGLGNKQPRIGFLFPGQGSPGHLQGGLLRRRFDTVDSLYTEAKLPEAGDEQDTTIAQPAIVTASLAALRVLHQLGISADISIGHSLGELTALHWAGAFNEQTLLQLARVRGQAMGTTGSPTGAMVSILAAQEVVDELIQGENVSIAGLNTPQQTVISGDQTAIASIIGRARSKQVRCIQLKVSRAFHSPLVEGAIPPLAEYLAEIDLQSPQRQVVSTITGQPLEAKADLKALLCKQITSPVQFLAAIQYASTQADLFIEVGPGKILRGLAEECTSIPTIAIDAGSSSLKGLFQAIGAAFVMGAFLNLTPLWENRFSRPFDLNWQPSFFANPCEQAPLPGAEIIFSKDEHLSEFNEELPGLESVAAQAQNQDSAIIDIIRQSIADRVELPLQAVGDNNRMLSDLHLNSITVGQIVSESARSLGLLPPTSPTDYADATVAEIAQALEELKQSGGTLEQADRFKVPQGVDTWIRPFQVEYIEQALSHNAQQRSEETEASWTFLSAPDYPFAEELRLASKKLPGAGVIVCLPPHAHDLHIQLLLQGIREILNKDKSSRFVLIQHGVGGAGVARTLALEVPEQTVCVVNIPLAHPRTVEWVMAEIQAAHGYTEAHYDEAGTRSIPSLQRLLLTDETLQPVTLGPGDVLLVTGGGKGIASECALSLALETGVRLALLGRSHPADDAELSANLKRFAAVEIDFLYLSADVTDYAAVQQAILEVEKKQGPVTAILHGAGTNTPRLLPALTEEDIQHTVGTKVHGLQHVLSAITPEKLRLLVTFGSVIARTGMRGEADYALANDWLAEETERFKLENPGCRCLCLEWSVWAGVGMGERLGRVEALMREGIMPIPVDKGVAHFQHLIKHQLSDVRVIITSRFGTVPTLRMATPDLPFFRFLEQPGVYYPGIELVTDAEISTTSDLYLDDHKFRGERLIPAVVGLEAMAQVAMAVTGNTQSPSFERVELERPIVVPERDRLKIRLAALVTESGQVDVVIRSEETAFQVDHFRATCRFDQPPLEAFSHFRHLLDPGTRPQQSGELSPALDLYGGILFHKGRFQRLHGYTHLRATECIAEITPYTEKGLFAQYVSSSLVLGDFLSRDAVIHCIQACIPQARLLPIAVESITIAQGSLSTSQPRFVFAKEISRDGDIFIYDVEVRTDQGELEEQWKALRLRQVEVLAIPEVWNEMLLGPYMERKLDEFLPTSSIQLVLQRHTDVERQTRSNLTFQHLLGSGAAVQRRPDGKPILTEHFSPAVSASHHAHLTLATASPRPIGCDIESVSSRSPLVWQDLLGPERTQLALFLSSQVDEELNTSATRLWAASESLKKAGAMANVPLRFGARKDDGWILLKAGSFQIATYITVLPGGHDRIVLAVCSEIENITAPEQIHRR